MEKIVSSLEEKKQQMCTSCLVLIKEEASIHTKNMQIIPALQTISRQTKRVVVFCV